MSVMVVMLATGCAVTKNNITQDASGYRNTSFQIGTPTIDTHTPGMHFKKPVMIPVPTGAPQPKQLSQAQGQQDQQVQGAVVVPDVSSICSTCDVQVASSDWTSSTPNNQQTQDLQASEPKPQYLMAWEEGASQASPGNVIVHDGIWGNGWVTGGTWFGGSRSSGWFGGSRGHSIHNRSVVSRGHYSSCRPTVSRTRCVTPSRSTCTTPARSGHSGHSGR